MRILTTALAAIAATALTAGAPTPAAAHGAHHGVKRGHVHYPPPRYDSRRRHAHAPGRYDSKRRHSHAPGRYDSKRRHSHAPPPRRRHAPVYRRSGPVIVIRTPPIVYRTYRQSVTTSGGGGGPTEVYAYPNRGQSAGRQDRDRYECHRWAYGQTGFDPSASGAGASTTSRVEYRERTGLNPITGAAGGALLGVVGGAVAGDAGKGAAIGAAVGATAGLLSHGARDRVVVTETRAQGTGPREDYLRALSACLEGRGYTVR